jgi:hypothetical protein
MVLWTFLGVRVGQDYDLASRLLTLQTLRLGIRSLGEKG